MNTVFLALGTNLGNRLANLNAAMVHIYTAGIVIKRCSEIWETEPIGVTDQPWFLNAVVQAETSIEPLDLLRRMKQVEVVMGREHIVVNGPRIIDIDLLFYNGIQMQTEELILPHPRIAERRFVLAPMAELAPTMKHPVYGSTMKELLEQAPPLGMVRYVKSNDWM